MEIEKTATRETVREVPKVIEVVKEIETIREIEIIREIEVGPEPEEPEEPEPEEPRPDPEDPTVISYCLMGSYPDGTFAYTFDGYLLTATLSYHYDAPPVSQVFDLSQLDFDRGDLPVMPIVDAWVDGPIVCVDLLGNGDPPERQEIEIPRGE